MIKMTNKRNIALGIGVIVLSLAGLGQTVWGNWTKFAGEAAKFFPRCVYVILIISSLLLIVLDLLGKGVEEPIPLPDMKWHYSLIYIGVGAVFFLGAYYLGTAVSIFAYLVVMISIFASDPKKDIKMTLIVSALATIAIYLIFTRTIPMLTPKQILF